MLLRGFVSLLALALPALAGPLDPIPAGEPVRRLAEAEPRIPIVPDPEAPKILISTPGSYFLTGSVVGTAGNNGIEIAANNVTLDLRGFSVIGVPGTLVGITVTTADRVNIRVFGGTVRGWGGNGIDLRNCPNAIVENIQTVGNTGDGIATGRAIIKCVQARSNNLVGIRTAASSSIIGCYASKNGERGIDTTFGGGSGTLVQSCVSEDNTLDGIRVGNGSSVLDCAAERNREDGIDVGSGCVVARCTARSNTAHGVRADTKNSITQCSADTNGSNGFNAGFGCVVAECIAGDNTGTGIVTATSCTIVNNVSTDNNSHGITCSGDSVISSNTCTYNTSDGIRVTSRARVVANTCSSNGSNDGAGIVATGTDNVIDSNLVASNDRGIDVDSGGNTIFRNAASGNTTNYDIIGGNDTGPIGTAASSTSPWANIAF